MKFPAFDYLRAETVDEAVGALARHGDDAAVLAGGQSLLPLLAMRLSGPAVLVDVNRIEGLGALVSDGEGGLRIGAMVRHAEVAADPCVRRWAPLLAEAARHVGHPGVRNRGTLGGSLSLADPAAEFPACVLALGATLTLVSSRGTREVAADAFFVGAMETAAAEDELLTAVVVPPARSGDHFAFHEISRRTGDYALAGAAVAWRAAAGGNPSVRVVVFGVSDRPVLARRAGAILEQGGLGPDATEAACETLGEEVPYLGSTGASAELKRHLSKVALRRAIGDIGRGGDDASDDPR